MVCFIARNKIPLCLCNALRSLRHNPVGSSIFYRVHMSLDKFVMRGFTGSLGSGEGRWVSTTQQYSGPSHQQTAVSHQGGTSFVMGGGPLKAKPAAKEHKQQGFSEERYSFDSRDIRDKGTRYLRDKSDSSKSGKSLVELANTKDGHRVVVALAMYGIFLALGIVTLIIFFGSGRNDAFYSAPVGFSGHQRAVWDR